MKLFDLERVSNLTKQEFKRKYANPAIPVIITDFAKDWEAATKWNLDFFKNEYGHLKVPIYSSNYSKPGKGYMSSDKEMYLKDFISEIQKGPTDLRMFLYNIFLHAPALCKDFKKSDLMDNFLDKFPMTFFGGKGAVTRLHYDIDMSNLFLTQFEGRKRVVLFSPEQTKYMYKQPFTVKSLIDVNHPDYERFPALKHVVGYDLTLQPGETLFMPSGYWHHIEYTDSGFSMTLRANDSMKTRTMGLLNIATHFVVDKSLNAVLGERWHNYKEKKAKAIAEEN